MAARVRNAGAIFVGSFAPVSLGDYCAGSNHVLPTAGCACHSSGLSVRAFLKAVHVVDYSRDGAAPRSPATWSRWPRPRTCPAHGAAVRGPVRAAERDRWTLACRCGRSCAASSRTARRSSTCPVQLNVNENPYGPDAEVVADIARGGGARPRRR